MSRVFRFAVSRETGETVGIQVRNRNGTLEVVKVLPNGAIHRTNERNRASKFSETLDVGDIVLKVNGIEKNASNMVHELNSSDMLVFTVSRHEIDLGERYSGAPVTQDFPVVLNLNGKGARVGLELEPTQGGALQVKCVGDGLVLRWNEEHPQMAVKAGDFLVAANGVSEDVSKMLHTILESKGTLVLVFRPTAVNMAR
jgi:hypothetical protein